MEDLTVSVRRFKARPLNRKVGAHRFLLLNVDHFFFSYLRTQVNCWICRFSRLLNCHFLKRAPPSCQSLKCVEISSGLYLFSVFAICPLYRDIFLVMQLFHLKTLERAAHSSSSAASPQSSWTQCDDSKKVYMQA